MKSWLCEWLLSCAVLLEGGPDIQELHYGRLLYAYYQQDYQQALVLALQAEQRGWRAQAPVRYTMAEGSFAFAQGMYRFADERFALLDDSQLSELDRQRLSFHLSREYLRRGDYEQLAGQLANLASPDGRLRRRELHPEVAFMQAELAIHQQQLGKADAWVQRIPEDHELAAYGRFNLAVAQHRAGHAEPALEHLLALSRTHPEDDINRDLRQRAALSAALLVRDAPELLTTLPGRRGDGPLEAFQALLPGEGRYRDAALSHYAQLAMRLDAPDVAADIWRHLQDSGQWQAPHMLARLALPLVLEQQQQRPEAVAAYERAETALVARIEQLNALQHELKTPQTMAVLLSGLTNGSAQTFRDWQDRLGHVQLLSWLSEPGLQSLVQEWRELSAASRWLAGLPEQLTSWSEVAAEQQRRSGQAAARLSERRLSEQAAQQGDALAGWSSRLDVVASQRPAADEAWFVALADAEQRRLRERLARLRSIAESGLADAEQERALARVARLEGLLVWALQEQQPVLIQALRNERAGLRALQADIENRLAFIAAAEADFQAGVGADFQALLARVAALQTRLADARLQREQVLATALQQRLEQESEQAAQYLAQARLGRARVLDALALSAVAP